jgi:hypothetical protein
VTVPSAGHFDEKFTEASFLILLLLVYLITLYQLHRLCSVKGQDDNELFIGKEAVVTLFLAGAGVGNEIYPRARKFREKNYVLQTSLNSYKLFAD